MEAGARTAGNRDEHEAPYRSSVRMHAAEVCEQFRRMVTVQRHSDRDTDCHRDQAETENRVNLTDDLVDRNERCDEVVAEDNGKPCRRCRERSGNALILEQLYEKACRANRENSTYHDQQYNREDSHNGLHGVAKIDAGNFGDRCTVVSLGKHAGEIIVNRAAERCAECDPQEYDGSPQSTLHGTKDRAKAGDVQQLNQEQLPLRHNNVVNAIVDRNGRCLTIIGAEGAVNEFAVGEVSND